MNKDSAIVYFFMALLGFMLLIFPISIFGKRINPKYWFKPKLNGVDLKSLNLTELLKIADKYGDLNLRVYDKRWRCTMCVQIGALKGDIESDLDCTTPDESVRQCLVQLQGFVVTQKNA